LLIACIGACSKSPEEAEAASVAAIRSWTATARLAGESWLQDKTPSDYTRTTLEKAETTLRQEFAALESAEQSRLMDSDVDLLRQPADVAQRMAAAVQRADRRAVAAEVIALASLDARIGSLDQRLQADGP
jgi:hypothetical protein